jgi:proteic killer suppression protein
MNIKMLFDFSNKHLLKLYTGGRSKKYPFMDKALCEKLVERINRIEAAKDIFDLRNPPSMEFERLAGYPSRFSIRITRKYRLEFEIEFEDKKRTLGRVLIVDVSKHYE